MSVQIAIGVISLLRDMVKTVGPILAEVKKTASSDDQATIDTELAKLRDEVDAQHTITQQKLRGSTDASAAPT